MAAIRSSPTADIGQTVPTVDPTRCPICGTPNACAMEIERKTGHAQPPCWCMNTTFTESLRAQVPEALQDRACICARCAAAAAAQSLDPT